MNNKIKVAEATNVQLDWMVAHALGRDYDIVDGAPITGKEYVEDGLAYNEVWAPTTNWHQGGPIIERECISQRYLSIADKEYRWVATKKPNIRDVKPKGVYGTTPLLAAMRCIVVSKFGNEVEVPEELC